ncbi:putative peptidase M16 domain-containing protein [Megalodesulfovibrio gigas DSM 1382 = ATCC 19364]|uniref:Putative peptidase M16 domain-containing protein n=2 Tax=Megalodesulfovibrio gigas TaxID=879 RepID=T2G6G5_MEGG1|nr:putative peptidase M16 domain-containing protein [Megalodesulfovibrio gigas DSM 1382 = ATCC 19364]
MIVSCVLFMCSMFTSTLQAATMPSADVNASSPRITRLPNGLTVLVQEDDRFPLVSLRLYVHAGSAFETSDQAGISHLLEHMVFKGTKTRAPGQVAQDIESAGGYLNAATSFDYTMYIADMPADRWELGMEVIQDMIFGATIDPAELASEKKVVLSELERGEDAPSARIFKNLQPRIWPGTTYARPIIGTRETVQAITAEDIHRYIAALYQPQSMLLAVCGQVQEAEVLAKATALFGALQNTAPVDPPQPLGTPQLDAVTQSIAGPSVQVGSMPLNKAYVHVTFPIPSFRSAKSTGLEVLAYLLGGDRTSRLYRTFKYERQLVDSISCSALMLERVGMFSIYATLDPADLERFWHELMVELSTLDAHTFSPEALARAKLNLEDELFQAKETIAGLTSKLGFFQFFENSPLAEENYFHELAAVTPDILQARIQEYLRPERLVASLLVPAPGQPHDNGNATLPANATTLGTPVTDADRAKALERMVRAAWGGAPERAGGPLAEQAFGQGRRGEPARVELGDGRALVLLPDATLPYTALTLSMRGGDHLVPPDKQGLAELTAWVFNRGTGNRTATEIQDFLADRAASMSVTAHRNLFTVSMKFPARFEQELLAFLEEALSSPAFSPEELAREQKNLAAAIRKREDQPMGLALRHVFPFLFRNHPYGYFHQGQPEEIASLTREDVLEFWQRQRTMPWTLAVCGEFSAERMTALATRLAAGIGGDPARGTLEWTAPQWGDNKTAKLHLAERNQAHLLIAFPLPGAGHPDTPGLTLLRATLAGMSGLLFSDLRDKQGLAYTVTAFLWQSPTTGALFFYIGADPEKMPQALEGFRKVTAQLHETPLPEDELRRGKNVLSGDYYRDHQSLLSRTDEAATLLTQGFPADLNREQLAAVQQLTPTDLQTLATRYLNWDAAYMLRVQP